MGRMEHLSREQLLDLLAQAKAVRERDWVLFLVTFWHGLRVSEAVGDPRNPRCPGLTPENFADGYLIVKRLKGSERIPGLEDLAGRRAAELLLAPLSKVVRINGRQAR